MAMEHEFVAVWQPADKKILYSEDVYTYINRGEIKKSMALELPDDVIQKILFDAHGKLLPDIRFNQWGISVYEKEELIHWIEFLKGIAGEAANIEYCHQLLNFMIVSYLNNNVVLHFGI